MAMAILLLVDTGQCLLGLHVNALSAGAIGVHIHSEVAGCCLADVIVHLHLCPQHCCTDSQTKNQQDDCSC